MLQGILKQVNGDFVLIDAKWYRVIDPKYIPKTMNVKVDFDTTQEDPGSISYIKEAGVTPGRAGGARGGYQNKDNRSIVRQVLFKGAIELVASGKHESVEAALAEVKPFETYLLGQ